MTKSNKPNSDEAAGGNVRTQTVISTQTVVEDRTEVAEDRSAIEYVSKDEDLGNGTIRTTIGEPVGGFPGSEAEGA